MKNDFMTLEQAKELLKDWGIDLTDTEDELKLMQVLTFERDIVLRKEQKQSDLARFKALEKSQEEKKFLK